MEGLGELGFWLAVGIVLAAMIVSGALKERDKEREKQATLRALLEKEGEKATEVLAYLREKDAAEVARTRARWVAAMGGNMSARQQAGWTAVAVGLLSFAGGVFAFGRLGRAESGEVLPILTMLGIWAVGLTIASALLIWGRSGKQKNDAHPDV